MAIFGEFTYHDITVRDFEDLLILVDRIEAAKDRVKKNEDHNDSVFQRRIDKLGTLHKKRTPSASGPMELKAIAALELARDGVAYDEIAREVGASQSWVSALARGNGIRRMRGRRRAS